MGRLSAEQVRAWVNRSCHEQRVPVAVTNPSTLSRIGVLLGRGRDAPQPEAAPRPDPSLQPPDGLDAVGVEPTRTRSRVGTNDGIVENGGHHGTLTVKVQPGPLGS
jgi:hypothetical protein